MLRLARSLASNNAWLPIRSFAANRLNQRFIRMRIIPPAITKSSLNRQT